MMGSARIIICKSALKWCLMHFCTAVGMNGDHCCKIIMIIEEFLEAEQN